MAGCLSDYCFSAQSLLPSSNAFLLVDNCRPHGTGHRGLSLPCSWRVSMFGHLCNSHTGIFSTAPLTNTEEQSLQLSEAIEYGTPKRESAVIKRPSFPSRRLEGHDQASERPEQDFHSFRTGHEGYVQLERTAELPLTDCNSDALKLNLEMGDFQGALDHLECPVDSATYVSLLHKCGIANAVANGRRVHDHIVRNGCEGDTYLGNNLIIMYRQFGSVIDARFVFDNLDRKNTVSWTLIISAHAQCGFGEEALQLFRKMHFEGVKPDRVTVSTIIRVCSDFLALDEGKEIHRFILEGGFESDIVVETALVSMYANCGNLEDARKVFDIMEFQNVVSWTAMITAYAQRNIGEEALELFEKMQLKGLKPNEFTFASVLSACATLKSLPRGQEIHAGIVTVGFEYNAPIGNALIYMYTKCGSLADAWRFFCKMKRKNVISWTAMLEACVLHGHTKDALQLFMEMQRKGVIPDKITFLSMLGACAGLGALEQGKMLHATLIARGFHLDEIVGTALINMYGKCGSIEDAWEVFDNMYHQNTHSWTAMIAVYAQHGFSNKAIQLFLEMQNQKIKPNDITFISILSACSHAGLVDDCWHYFRSMRGDYGVTPTAEHHACMVDLFGRAGLLREAEDFILKIPLEPDLSVWQTMLRACIAHCDVERGKLAAEKCIQLDPGYGAPYTLLSNIYAAEGKLEDVAKIRKLMKDNGAKQQPGRSSIEIKGKIHEFVVGDRSHPQIEKIYEELEKLFKQMEKLGYMPETKVVLHDVEDELHERFLKYHSEKLAIVFGHIMTPPKTTLHLIKNLRVCPDCHVASKFISKILQREIIIREPSRIHHFKEGVCSCLDYG